jgi:membrane-associated protease RseP (regulator of RpoE activity)
MRSWKGLAVAATLAVAAAGAAADAIAAGGQSGARRDPPMPAIDQRFELWGAPRTRLLGVTLRELTPAEAKERKLPTHAGVLVETVGSKGPAEAAGMKAGDVIVRINGENVRSIAQVHRLVNETPAGQGALVTVARDGKTMDLSVTPETAPAGRANDDLRREIQRLFEDLRQRTPRGDEFGRYFDWGDPPPDQDRRREPFAVPPPRFRWPLFEWSPGASRLGIVIQGLEPQLAGYFKVKDGVLVASVTPDTPAAAAGLKAGDVITALDGKAVKTPDDLVRMVRDLPGGQEVSLSVVRSGAPLTIKLKLGASRGVWQV